jgi:plasmid maintenance system antidote protein VapI
MKKDEELKDKTRNNNFAAALDYLKRNKGIKTQNELAKRMGCSKDTITRIIKAYTPVTEDAITKFQTATGCIFNLQWLRGESDVMMTEDLEVKSVSEPENTHQSALMPDYSSITNAMIAAKDDAIESLKRELVKTEESAKRELAAKDDAMESLKRELVKTEESAKRELAAKDETISALRSQLATKDELIKSLQQQVADLRAALALQQTKDSLGNYPFTVGVADNDEISQAQK